MHRLFTILLLLSAIGYTSLTAGFRTEQVDAKDLLFYMTDRSGKVDTNGAMHIAYGVVHLYYATNKSGSWVIETIDDSLPVIGRDASIAFDSSGSVHIAYRGRGFGLKYATNTSGNWVLETVDNNLYYGYSTSIAIDSNDNVHISYNNYPIPYDPPSVHLRYATNASGSWVIETIDNSRGSGHESSIAVDGNNKVHISYRNDDGLKYATNKNSSWVIETVATSGGDTSIALDSNGYIHISYHANYKLNYATNISGNWITQVLDSGGDTGRDTSLAIDSNNNVHISYYYSDGFSNASYKIRYIHNKNGSWMNEEVDSSAGVGEYTSISLDRNNKVHISYFDRTNVALKYATNATVTVPLFGPLGALLLIALFGLTAIRKIDKV